ncbi:hypothetical protein WANA31_0817 [Wolbachia endosymbiont of Drosophila ananassae]|nr:hypothetical protein WANA31_0817 [Wolbachia endosymbiont of Drosophila ananassae]RLT63059.1 hypothetical protein WANA34_0844 [Wolbachia endosymbiont of Drosophila ananassae]
MSRYLDDTYNLVIPVLPPLSSQCLTLGWLCCIATYES